MLLVVGRNINKTAKKARTHMKEHLSTGTEKVFSCEIQQTKLDELWRDCAYDDPLKEHKKGCMRMYNSLSSSAISTTWKMDDCMRDSMIVYSQLLIEIKRDDHSVTRDDYVVESVPFWCYTVAPLPSRAHDWQGADISYIP